MRLFVAAELSEELLDALAQTSALLRESVHGRYVAPDSFHVTLAFLGDVPESQVDSACEALEQACEGVPAIPVTLAPLGSFGRAKRATLWQGFSRGVDELAGLAGDVRECLVEAGLSFDATLFVPHVTLMRAADLSGGELPMPVMEKGLIRSVTLFSSDLSGDRPRYEALQRVWLEEEADDGYEETYAGWELSSEDAVDYPLLAAQLRALGEGERSKIPVLANASALINEALPDVSWVGFYLADGEGGLELGPFQGKVACTHIGWGKGVCGTAAVQDRTQPVPDVHAFPGHIACDSASRSEVVVPIHQGGEVCGVLDLDSTSLARFTERDAAGLEMVVSALEELLPGLR